MATAAVHARGTKIAYGDGASPEVFTDVAEALDISAPSPTRGEIEVTNHDSPSLTKEFIADDVDPGSMSFDVNFLSATAATSQTQVQTDFDAGTVKNWRIRFTNNRQWIFPAYVNEFTAAAPATGSQLKATIGLRLTGTITRSTYV